MRAHHVLVVLWVVGASACLPAAGQTAGREISLMVGNRVVVQAKGSQIPDQKAAEDYLNALDLTAVQRALTN